MSKKYAVNLVNCLKDNTLDDIRKEYESIRKTVNADIKSLNAGEIPTFALLRKTEFLNALLIKYNTYKFIEEKALN